MAAFVPAGAAEWADMEAAGQLGSALREADTALIQLAPLRPYAAGVSRNIVSVALGEHVS